MILEYQYLRLKLWAIQEALLECKIEKAKKKLDKLRCDLYKEENKEYRKKGGE